MSTLCLDRIDFSRSSFNVASFAGETALSELTADELDLVAGGLEWGKIFNQAAGGAITGGVGGAVGGAITGGMAGGVGAIPGAITGGIGGAVAGGIAGGGMEIWNELSQ